MNLIFYSPVFFEKWDWRNSAEKGIGGSETSHVEMAWRLARYGYNVITYAPIPDDCPGEWRNTRWYSVEDVDCSLPGVWILYRCPRDIDNFQKNNNQRLWLMMQDWDYPMDWTPERLDKLERIIPLSKAHADYLLERHPEFKDKIWITSNALKIELLDEVMKDAPERNPNRIMFASSPDRGLLALLEIFERAIELVPTLELHAFYGFNNIDKLIEAGIPGFKTYKDKCFKLIDKLPNITFHGRVSQNQLYREWASSAMWVYCTTFSETSNIACMEAQACGTIPIFSPIWAQKENIRHGIGIFGHPENNLTIARFANAVATVACNPTAQEKFRVPMMHEAKIRFGWERFVEQWDYAIQENGYFRKERGLWPATWFEDELPYAM